MDSCVDFEYCFDPFNELDIISSANCIDTYCTACNDNCTSLANKAGDGRIISCPSNSYPSTSGKTSTGSVGCVCDGKTVCKWKSQNFQLGINKQILETANQLCISDSECPVSIWKSIQTTPSVNYFIQDSLFNTKQSELYDVNQAEIRAKIESSVIINYDFSNGGYLVLIFEESSDVIITPYGDYREPIIIESGLIVVYETFTNFNILNDGSPRSVRQYK